ncbi:hypothetical protein DXA36_16290 [Eisenbergiella sp. OF01-20]|uniref:Uncharacterized protein n=2 Tax=Lachnospiraceae TaxID=186803 RepID=A0A3E3IBT8_9FIRM|nr:hypothetical protein DWY69_27030 [Eisenbergiella massiliensis]RGM06315.1 hypothetical protein DXC39_09180 [Hungatella hathewayi]RHM80792.1 hypothetical protein DWZ48_09590 [Hungatella hathewayi]RHP87434.1 hypothetical protein DXA36_16290 [Eisenbergiella sp. OF01-20]
MVVVRAIRHLVSHPPEKWHKKSRKPFQRFPAGWCRLWAAGIQLLIGALQSLLFYLTFQI